MQAQAKEYKEILILSILKKPCSYGIYQILKVIFAWKTSLNQNRDVTEVMNICNAKRGVSSFL